MRNLLSIILVLAVMCISGCVQNTDRSEISINTVNAQKNTNEIKSISEIEHSVLGPYEVSFNLAKNMGYSINVGKETRKYGGEESRQSLNYPLTISSYPYTAEITLIKWSGPMQPRFDNQVRNTMSALKDLGYYNITCIPM